MSNNQPHYNNSHRSLQPSWWNDDCARAKYNKYKCLRRFRTTNQSSDLNLFHTTSNEFKSICKQAKLSFEKEKRQKLVNSSKSPKMFWNLIKSSRTDPSSIQREHVSYGEWYDYFKHY